VIVFALVASPSAWAILKFSPSFGIDAGFVYSTAVDSTAVDSIFATACHTSLPRSQAVSLLALTISSSVGRAPRGLFDEPTGRRAMGCTHGGALLTAGTVSRVLRVRVVGLRSQERGPGPMHGPGPCAMMMFGGSPNTWRGTS